MSYVEIPLPRLAIAALLIVIAIMIAWRLHLELAGRLAIGALRAAVQLVAVGYFLTYVFAHERAWLVLTLLVAMTCIAAITSARRIEHGPSMRVLLPSALVAVAGSAAIALVPMFALVLMPRPWFEARFLLPISGMILSNAMNVVAQVFERMFASARAERAIIEQLLALGASPQQAMSTHARAAIVAAMIPTINGLLTVGLVSLPGMMTGQILSGTDPTQAIRYQLVILYQLVAVAAVAGALASLLARRLLFTTREQLVAANR